MDAYINLAREMKMLDARIISMKDIVFDERALLKCYWGCESFMDNHFRCHKRNTTYTERRKMIEKYDKILLIHSHNARDVSKAVLEIERRAFLDGYYFSFAIRYCSVCRECSTEKGVPCIEPKKVRPCEAIFGIDVYRTVRNLGLPIEPLQDKDDVQNRYGFVLIGP